MPTGTARPIWRIAIALGLLALALVCAWMGWQAHQKRVSATGLTALTVQPDRSVWLSINKELWHLDAQGRAQTRLTAPEAELPAAPRRLAALDNQVLYALVPGVPDLAVLDASTGRLQRRVALQWPTDMPGSSVATTADLAVAQDGRIALAQTGTSSVLVFDAQGRLLIRSGPKTLSQPTSLWWDDGELWVADTGQHQLLRLSGNTLAVKQTVQLSAKVATRQTVRAIHHPRAGIDVQAPVATLIRLEPDSPIGLVTYEWPDGMEIGQDIGPKGQPRDLAWIGETLLVLENLELRLLRFDVDRHGLGDFGDMTVQHWLEQAFKTRERLRREQWAWAGGAVLSMLLMLGLAGTLLRRQAAPQEDDANERALRWLDENPAWQAVQMDQESVRDTIELRGRDGDLWLILSNRRLVAFNVDGQHTLPRGAWHRTDVVEVALTPAGKAAGRWPLGKRQPACQLSIRLNDGTVLQGGTQSQETAERMAAVLRLGMPPAAPQAPAQAPTPA
ncbi:MAG TPA: hypothetical protein H9903_18695 [Candidatus Aquabacterium excrementipullorum]|nr:hypothetical protein [Candidatus Aquabacterium excrementipullorum]